MPKLALASAAILLLSLGAAQAQTPAGVPARSVEPPGTVTVTAPEPADATASDQLWAQTFGGALPDGAVAFLVPDYATDAVYDPATGGRPPESLRALFGIARLRVIVPQRAGMDPECVAREAMRYAVSVSPAVLGVNIAQARAAEEQVGPTLEAAFASKDGGAYDERVRRALSGAFGQAVGVASPAMRKIAPILATDGAFASCAALAAPPPERGPTPSPEDLARTLERLQRR